MRVTWHRFSHAYMGYTHFCGYHLILASIFVPGLYFLFRKHIVLSVFFIFKISKKEKSGLKAPLP